MFTRAQHLRSEAMRQHSCLAAPNPDAVDPRYKLRVLSWFGEGAAGWKIHRRCHLAHCSCMRLRNLRARPTLPMWRGAVTVVPSRVCLGLQLSWVARLLLCRSARDALACHDLAQHREVVRGWPTNLPPIRVSQHAAKFPLDKVAAPFARPVWRLPAECAPSPVWALLPNRWSCGRDPLHPSSSCLGGLDPRHRRSNSLADAAPLLGGRLVRL